MNYQILIYCLCSSLVLSMVALGFNLIFNATKVFHIAHGALYVTGIYTTYYLNKLFGLDSGTYSILLAIIGSVILNLLLILVIEWVFYRPLYLKNADPNISLITSLGIYILVTNLISFFCGTDGISLNNNYIIIFSTSAVKLTQAELTQIAAGSLMVFGLLFFSKTKGFLPIKAISCNYQVSEKFGISIARTRIVALFIGTFLVTIAGIVNAYAVSAQPNMGLSIVLLASVAVIAGGIGSLRGTVIVCFFIAAIQNFSVTFLSAQWKDCLTYILLAAVLVGYNKGFLSVKQRVEAK